MPPGETVKLLGQKLTFIAFVSWPAPRFERMSLAFKEPGTRTMAAGRRRQAGMMRLKPAQRWPPDQPGREVDLCGSWPFLPRFGQDLVKAAARLPDLLDRVSHL